MKTIDYGPLFSGETLRDRGIEKVSRNNESWMEQALKIAVLYVRAWREHDFTGEDVRFYCETVVESPKHPNAWGALIKELSRRKVIRATGKYRQPKDKSSHSRAIQVYEAF